MLSLVVMRLSQNMHWLGIHGMKYKNNSLTRKMSSKCVMKLTVQ